jgi:hypothetical protein
MDWFVTELQKPADLRLVFNGAPNFEYDYSYASLTDFPGAKKEFIDALRRSGAEKVRAILGQTQEQPARSKPRTSGWLHPAAPTPQCHLRRTAAQCLAARRRSSARHDFNHLAPLPFCAH